ncbi:MAG TPA: hypothetical protein PLW65_02865 [Pseudomonadota bacterium]|nr:hypothetical protein [Pseudomonadota bacterium]
MRRWRLLLATLCFVAAGCVQFAQLEVNPSGCVNPASGICPSSGGSPDSRILELRLYQLKAAILPCKLDVNALVDGPDKDMDLLKNVLADGQRKDVARQIEQIEASKSKKLARWPLLPETRYILAVAVGRSRGKNTVRLLAREQATQGAIIYVRGTNLCFNGSCETSLEEQCP